MHSPGLGRLDTKLFPPRVNPVLLLISGSWWCGALPKTSPLEELGFLIAAAKLRLPGK